MVYAAQISKLFLIIITVIVTVSAIEGDQGLTFDNQHHVYRNCRDFPDHWLHFQWKRKKSNYYSKDYDRSASKYLKFGPGYCCLKYEAWAEQTKLQSKQL